MITVLTLNELMNGIEVKSGSLKQFIISLC